MNLIKWFKELLIGKDIITKLPNGGELWEFDNGDKYYYLNNRRHRKDGPAVDYINGDKRWYFNGEYIPCKTQKEFERLMRLKAFW